MFAVSVLKVEPLVAFLVSYAKKLCRWADGGEGGRCLLDFFVPLISSCPQRDCAPFTTLSETVRALE